MAGTAERTERATPRRRDEARKRGQVARSREINTAASLLALFGLLAALGGWLLAGFVDVVAGSLSSAGEPGAMTPDAAWGHLMHAGRQSLRLIAPFAAGGLAVGVLASMIQVRPGITPQVLRPRFSAISPVTGFKRLLGPRSLVTLVRDLLKVAITAGVAWMALKGSVGPLSGLMGAGPGTTLVVTGNIILRVGFAIAAAYVVLAVLDLVYERWQHERDIRMTRDEVRREAREADVSPEVKGQLKRRQREMAVRRMMAAVPEADVVITNPTHYAVALRYARAFPAPQVVAKGADNVARRIIDLAREHGVTVVQDPPLARSLHAAAEVGQLIPPAAFEAVAEILAHVYRATGREPAAA